MKRFQPSLPGNCVVVVAAAAVAAVVIVGVAAAAVVRAVAAAAAVALSLLALLYFQLAACPQEFLILRGSPLSVLLSQESSASLAIPVNPKPQNPETKAEIKPEPYTERLLVPRFRSEP